MPSPTFAAAARAASASTTSSWIDSGTYTRLIAEQIWPELSNAPVNSLSVIAATSTSSSTIAGSLPPSSSVTRLRSGAAAAATCLPVATEPVKQILRGVGCDVIHSPSSSPPVTTLSTPGGSTSLSISPIMSELRGVNGDGFSTIVLPASNAGAIFHAASIIGKFHGVIAATTPIGRRMTSA